MFILQCRHTLPIGNYPKSLSGLTLLETIVVALIISILAAIAAPSWLYMLNIMSLNNAQDEVFQGMRKAQQNARINRIVWEFGIRQTLDNQVEWTIYPSTADGSIPTNLVWKPLDDRIQLDQETTLSQKNNIRRVQFSHLGTVNGQLGRVTLSMKAGGKAKRCVVVSTLLGAFRLGSDQPTAKDGKYCR